MLLEGDCMLRRRLVLLVLDIWRVLSRVLRRLLLLERPRCWLASRRAVSNLVISDFRPYGNRKEGFETRPCWSSGEQVREDDGAASWWTAAKFGVLLSGWLV